MNGVKVTVKCEAIKGMLRITQDANDDSLYIIQATNYQPYEVSGNSLGEVIDRALASIHQMKRTVEFRAKQSVRAARMMDTRRANGTVNVHGPKKTAGKPKRKTHGSTNDSLPDIDLAAETQQLAHTG